VKSVASDKTSDLFVYEKHIARTVPDGSSKAYLLGSAVHKLVLEPRHFKQDYFLPDGLRKPTERQIEMVRSVDQLIADLEAKGKQPTKADQKRIDRAKEIYQELSAYEAYEAANEGKQALTSEEYELTTKIRDAVMRHPEAKEIIKSAMTEVSVFWRDPQTDLVMKGRADILTSDCIYDLKTVEDISPEGFARAAIKYGYDIQAAFYQLGFQMPKFKFICVTKKPPFEVAIYELDDEWIEAAHVRVREAIEHFDYCVTNNVWKGFKTQQLPVPKWYAAKYLGA
jgi:hypothetical protein